MATQSPDLPFVQELALDAADGNHITNAQNAEPIPWGMAQGLRQKHVGRPTAIPRTDFPTNLYNCHGLVFAGRRTTIENSQTVLSLLVRDQYVEVDGAHLLPGDIALYIVNGAVEHSAVVVRVESIGAITVVSKWGPGLEYVHHLRDCTYAEQPDVDISFYRMELRNDPIGRALGLQPPEPVVLGGEHSRILIP